MACSISTGVGAHHRSRDRLVIGCARAGGGECRNNCSNVDVLADECDAAQDHRAGQHRCHRHLHHRCSALERGGDAVGRRVRRRRAYRCSSARLSSGCVIERSHDRRPRAWFPAVQIVRAHTVNGSSDHARVVPARARQHDGVRNTHDRYSG